MNTNRTVKIWANRKREPFFEVQCNLYLHDVSFHQLLQPDSQGLHLRYQRYGEGPDTGWSRGTQILGA